MKAAVLLVGLGQIGMGYDLHLDSSEHIYSHARAFSQHPAFNLIAGVDHDAQRRQIFERKYGRPAYSDLESAVGNHRVDVVAIASPTRSHAEVLRSVLSLAQPKLILCEKPLAYDLEDARWMLKECSARNVRLYVNYMRRSDPGVVEIKNRIDTGKIEAPVKGVVWYSKGFIHNGSHFFNLLEYWLGSMERVEMLDRGREWHESDSEPDVRVIFKRGTVVFLAAREEAFSHYTVELVTPNGRLRYDQGGEIVEWQQAVPDPGFQGYTTLSSQAELIVSGMDRYQWHVTEQLAAEIDGRQFNLCSGYEALTTLESMHRVMELR